MQPQGALLRRLVPAQPTLPLSQVDDRNLGGLGLGCEKLALGEAHGPGYQHVREGLERVVELEDRRVEVLARERDLVLCRGQLLLQREDVLVGLELRVVLDNCEQGAQAAGESILSLGLRGSALRTGGNSGGSGLGDLCQDALLEVHAVSYTHLTLPTK